MTINDLLAAYHVTQDLAAQALDCLADATDILVHAAVTSDDAEATRAAFVARTIAHQTWVLGEICHTLAEREAARRLLAS